MTEIPNLVDLFIVGVLTDWRTWLMVGGLVVVGYWFRPRPLIITRR